MPKPVAASYQEAAVSWLPFKPWLSWPLLCLVGLIAIVLVLHSQSVPTLEPKGVKPLILLGLSYVVIVYEILGIIVGQQRSKKLEELLPQLLGPNYHHPPLSWDQRCLPGWGEMLSWYGDAVQSSSWRPAAGYSDS